MRHAYITTLLLAAAILCGCAQQETPTVQEVQLQTFIDNHLETIEPLAKQAALASWDAAVTGDPNAYDRSSDLTLQIRTIYRDPDDFAYLKDLKQSGAIGDPLLARQLDVLYNAYLSNQIDAGLLRRIVELSTEIEKNFSTFRATIDGQTVTDNEIKEILKTATDSAVREQAWRAGKQVAPVVASDLVRLVKLRNEAARELGFDNYHRLVLTTGEQDVNELDQVFEELKALTDKPFAALKADLDRRLAANCNIAAETLRPWHYHDPFFQETPMVYDLDLDVYYADKDIEELGQRFYAGIGLPVESVLVNSDLYEKEGKNPHAFCTDIDRQGDVRILCNLKNNETWTETLLHELGHAVYNKYQDPETPYLLREPAHIFTTEAIAMLFGRLSRDPVWMQQMLGLTNEQRAEVAVVSGKYAQLKQLIFARWAMVMYAFEKELYADPDQDLNALWWDMVETYQLVRRPDGRNAPDWAAKIHFSIAPCYYHNYLLGELLASQLNHHIAFNVLELDSDKAVNYVGRPEIGRFLREKVFEVGNRHYWNRMIEHATGEPLTPKHFVAQFVQ